MSNFYTHSREGQLITVTNKWILPDNSYWCTAYNIIAACLSAIKLAQHWHLLTKLTYPFFWCAKSVVITSTEWGRTNTNVNILPSVLACAKEPAEPVLDETSNNIAAARMTWQSFHYLVRSGTQQPSALWKKMHVTQRLINWLLWIGSVLCHWYYEVLLGQ